MSFMKKKSGNIIKIVDSCVLIDNVRSRNLEHYLTTLSQKYSVQIPLHVKNEVKDILIDYPDAKDLNYFEKSIKNPTGETAQ